MLGGEQQTLDTDTCSVSDGSRKEQVYSLVEHLARSMWLSDFCWSNRMAMYSAYFDESGHPDSGTYMVVAGCVADVDQWSHLDREWKELLGSFGIEIFHATDFEQRKPPFDQITDVQAEQLILGLARIICRRVEKSVSHALSLAQYERINAKYVFAECHGFPYAVLARNCISKVEHWMDRYSVPKSEVLFFFENGAKHRGQLEWIALRDKLPEPRFENKSLTPLQAGDLLAWCHNLYLTNNGNIPLLYKKALDLLNAASSDWTLNDLSDTDRIPTIAAIPLRDPNLRYRAKIIKHKGRKMAVTRYWPREQVIEPKINKKTLKLPDGPPLTQEQLIEAAKMYNAAKGKVKP